MPPTIAAGFLGIEAFTPPWDVFFLPLFNLLIFFYQVLFSDFALAIIVFTIVIRTLLAPLFVRQIRSSKEMQRMQPLVREVQRKHKGNRQKISEETMALYREHGVNPAAGCLPLIVQLPILFALYQALLRASGVVQNFTVNDNIRAAFERLQDLNLIQAVAGRANEYRIAVDGPCSLPEFSQLPQFLPLNCQLIDPFKLASSGIDTTIGWLLNLDLAQVDRTFSIPVFGFYLSALAVVAAILQFVQVKMSSAQPNPDDPTAGVTNTMIYTFPLLTIVWGGFFPAGLILYWIVYTAYLIGQQFFIMGWGNLFPLFGWRPAFVPSPEAGIVPQPRRSEARPTDGRSQQPANPRPEAHGNRTSRQAPRPSNRRSGSAKRRRGRRR